MPSHSTYISNVNYDAEHGIPGQCDDHLKNMPVRRARAAYRNSFHPNVSFTGYGYYIFYKGYNRNQVYKNILTIDGEILIMTRLLPSWRGLGSMMTNK